MKKRFFPTIILSVTLSVSVIAQSNMLQPGAPAANGFSPERLQRMDGLIKQYIDSNWIKGAVALIAHNGKIVYDKSFGVDNTNPMKEDAIFRIASQTKAITSVAVMSLFEEGKFLLDDPISKYIPSFAHPQVLATFNEKDTTYTTVPAKREVTIRDLLTHTSGLDYADIGSPKMKAIYAKANIGAGFMINKQLLADAINKLGTLPLGTQPGEKWTYSLGVDVLGRLVEVASGMSLDDYFHKHIFDPLGMNDTYFHLPEAKQQRLASVNTENYRMHKLELWKDGTFPGSTVNYPINNNGYYAGGAGLVSTIKDYAIFLQMLLNGGSYNGKKILARHTVDIMTMNQIGDLNVGLDKFGLGFEITSEKGMAKLGQSVGSFAWGGFFGTIYWVDTKEKIVALLFIQQWPFSHAELHDKFKAMVYSALN